LAEFLFHFNLMNRVLQDILRTQRSNDRVSSDGGNSLTNLASLNYGGSKTGGNGNSYSVPSTYTKPSVAITSPSSYTKTSVYGSSSSNNGAPSSYTTSSAYGGNNGNNGAPSSYSPSSSYAGNNGNNPYSVNSNKNNSPSTSSYTSIYSKNKDSNGNGNSNNNNPFVFSNGEKAPLKTTTLQSLHVQMQNNKGWNLPKVKSG
jgi:hypothetical protein